MAVQLHRETMPGPRNQVGGVVIQPGDPGYDDARALWNGRFDR